MRLPVAIAAEVERVGKLLLAGEISYEEAIDAIEPLLDKEEHRLFLSFLKRRWIRQQIKAYNASRIAVAAEEEETGQQPLFAPDLPAHIEIAVATFKHQNAMTLKDWNAAVRQAENKASNAAGNLDRILRARDRAAEILHGDETIGEATG